MKKVRAWATDPQTKLSAYVDAIIVKEVKFDNNGNAQEPLIANPNPNDFKVVESGFENYAVEEIMYALPA